MLKHVASLCIGIMLIITALYYASIPKQATAAHALLSTTPSQIYGTNLGLYDTNDQVVDDPATQQFLRNAHVSVIRIPYRASLGDSYYVKALQAIQSIGAIPLVIVNGPKHANPLADDLHILPLVQSVFGSGTVWIEYGNESDLGGINAAQYTASWNAVIPQLKAMAPTYKFIGPVLASFNAGYLKTFDSTANPRPDANSWHEYACAASNSNQQCMDNVAKWTTHIQTAANIAQQATGAAIPSMITEWNLDPFRDSRFGDSAFVQEWTSLALQTLAMNTSNGLVAATQYCVTNNGQYRLLDATNTPTPQGAVFFQALQAA